ncbi:MAG: 4Fe-4S binding protein [Eubacteriaceae bacterium]|nr:4Fe-4S binding protein [Eubacteriaceae bacterium]
MNSKRYVLIDRKRCVACGACLKECPRNAIVIHKGCYAESDKETCVGCGRCADTCPAGAIEVLLREDYNE